MRKLFPILVGLSSLAAASAFSQDSFPIQPGDPGEADPVKPLADPTAKHLPKVAKASEAVPPPPVESTTKADTPKPPLGVTPKAHLPEYIIKSGDSLTKVSAEAYGRRGYWRLLKLYNDADPNRLKVGQVIKTPEIAWLLEQEGVVPLFADAAEDLMKGRAIFMETEDELRKQVTGANKVAPDEEAKKQIKNAQRLIAAAGEKFAEKREGVSGLPNSTLQQLRTVSKLMGQVAEGTSNTAGKMSLVHEHFGNALTYCIIWAREGFK